MTSAWDWLCSFGAGWSFFSVEAAVADDAEGGEEPAKCGGGPGAEDPDPAEGVVSVGLPVIDLADVDERNDEVEGVTEGVEAGLFRSQRPAVGPDR